MAMACDSKNTSDEIGTRHDLHIELPGQLSAALDAWIAVQIEPRPTREEAVLRLLREALGTRFGS